MHPWVLYVRVHHYTWRSRLSIESILPFFASCSRRPLFTIRATSTSTASRTLRTRITWTTQQQYTFKVQVQNSQWTQLASSLAVWLSYLAFLSCPSLRWDQVVPSSPLVLATQAHQLDQLAQVDPFSRSNQCLQGDLYDHLDHQHLGHLWSSIGILVRENQLSCVLGILFGQISCIAAWQRMATSQLLRYTCTWQTLSSRQSWHSFPPVKPLSSIEAWDTRRSFPTSLSLRPRGSKQTRWSLSAGGTLWAWVTISTIATRYSWFSCVCVWGRITIIPSTVWVCCMHGWVWLQL